MYNTLMMHCRDSTMKESFFFFFSSRRRHTRCSRDWSSDVCSSDLEIYHEAFRIERDFFYDPGFHGLDLAATEKKYAAYLPGLASREDLNYIFAEAMGELSVGHLFVSGGDGPEVRRVPVGLLGADYKIENG